MRFGYLYKRPQKELAEQDCKEVFIDTDRNRPKLAELLGDFIRAGHDDEIVVVSEDDIPKRGPFLDAIRSAGVTVTALEGEHGEPGRPVEYNPTGAQTVEHANIWHTPHYRSYAAKLISDDYGKPVSERTLNRRYGKLQFNPHE